MKILVVCQYFYPEQFSVNDICFELVKQGHQITVLTGLPNYPIGKIDKKYRWFKNRYEDINGVDVRRSWLLGRGKGIARLVLNYVSFAISALVKSLFLKKDFDLILVYQLSPVTMALPGIMLKKITGKPLLIYCYDLWPESVVSAGVKPGSKIYNLIYRMSKWIYHQADEVFVSSKRFMQYFNHVLGYQSCITYLPVYADTLFDNIDNSIVPESYVKILKNQEKFLLFTRINCINFIIAIILKIVHSYNNSLNKPCFIPVKGI